MIELLSYLGLGLLVLAVAPIVTRLCYLTVLWVVEQFRPSPNAFASRGARRPASHARKTLGHVSSRGARTEPTLSARSVAGGAAQADVSLRRDKGRGDLGRGDMGRTAAPGALPQRRAPLSASETVELRRRAFGAQTVETPASDSAARARNPVVAPVRSVAPVEVRIEPEIRTAAVAGNAPIVEPAPGEGVRVVSPRSTRDEIRAKIAPAFEAQPQSAPQAPAAVVDEGPVLTLDTLDEPSVPVEPARRGASIFGRRAAARTVAKAEAEAAELARAASIAEAREAGLRAAEERRRQLDRERDGAAAKPDVRLKVEARPAVVARPVTATQPVVETRPVVGARPEVAKSEVAKSEVAKIDAAKVEAARAEAAKVDAEAERARREAALERRNRIMQATDAILARAKARGESMAPREAFMMAHREVALGEMKEGGDAEAQAAEANGSPDAESVGSVKAKPANGGTPAKAQRKPQVSETAPSAEKTKAGKAPAGAAQPGKAQTQAQASSQPVRKPIAGKGQAAKGQTAARAQARKQARPQNSTQAASQAAAPVQPKQSAERAPGVARDAEKG